MNSENFQAEIFGITEAVGLALEGLDFVVDALEGAGGNGGRVPRKKAVEVISNRLAKFCK